MKAQAIYVRTSQLRSAKAQDALACVAIGPTTSAIERAVAGTCAPGCGRCLEWVG